MITALEIEFAKLTARMRESRASEVSFLSRLHETLAAAYTRRDWSMVRDIMQVVDQMATDLSSVDDHSS